MDRASATTFLVFDHPPTGPGYVHPYSAAVGAMNAIWQSWDPFHAGSLVIGGQVWALLGDREDGKSSTLAWAHLHGFPVFSDDLTVLRDFTALAGPRSLDLRQSASEYLGVGEDVGVLGTRRRWRIQLPQVPAELPFGGWIKLSWRDGPPACRVAKAKERLRSLTAARAIPVHAPDPRRWLILIAAPMIVFERPRDWSEMEQSWAALLDAVEATASLIGEKARAPER
ncbi:MAG TPA: hypothetical protein VG435_01595 [Acidimicrobiales bacterium]|nr:hypothetical protein [Acidimicrobiales bacterium]